MRTRSIFCPFKEGVKIYKCYWEKCLNARFQTKKISLLLFLCPSSTLKLKIFPQNQILSNAVFFLGLPRGGDDHPSLRGRSTQVRPVLARGRRRLAGRRLNPDRALRRGLRHSREGGRAGGLHAQDVHRQGGEGGEGSLPGEKAAHT